MSYLPVSLRLLAVADARDQFVSFLAGTHDNAHDSWGDYVSSCREWESSDWMTSEFLADRFLRLDRSGDVRWPIAHRMAAVWLAEADRLACDGL